MLLYVDVSIADAKPDLTCLSKMLVDEENKDEEAYAKEEIYYISKQQVNRFQ